MRSLMLLGVACASLALAACGSSSSSSGASSAAKLVDANNSKALAFSSCMRSHGVPSFPDLGSGGRIGIQVQSNSGNVSVNGASVNGPAFQSAMQACHSQLPNGGQGPRQLPAAARQAALQFSQCMRSHGLAHFPDPQFNGGGVGIRITPGSGINPGSPAFKAAQAACQPIMQRTFSKGAGVAAAP